MARGLILTVAGFVLLAGIAVAGWVRKPELPQNCVCVDPAVMQAAAMQQAMQQAAWNSPYAGPAAYPGVYPAAYQQQAQARPVVQRQYVTRTVKRPRPFGHSVAIVGGSAGAGAAIGALAGGGKGAAIGALSGGTAGFIFDRLTANRNR